MQNIHYDCISDAIYAYDIGKASIFQINVYSSIACVRYTYVMYIHMCVYTLRKILYHQNDFCHILFLMYLLKKLMLTVLEREQWRHKERLSTHFNVCYAGLFSSKEGNLLDLQLTWTFISVENRLFFQTM